MLFPRPSHYYLHYCGIFFACFFITIVLNIISSFHTVFSLCARVGWCDVCTEFTKLIKVVADVNWIFITWTPVLYKVVWPGKKSRHNMREKISYFFTCVDITNQLLTLHLPLAPSGQVDEWTAKPSWFSIRVVCRSFLKLWRLKQKKNPYRW